MAEQTYYKVRYQPTAEEVGLPAGREYVFPGLFLAWLVVHDLLSQDLSSLVGGSTIDKVKARELTGPRLLEYVDGIIDDSMLVEEGQAFAERYFDLLNEGDYLRDYQRVFGISGGAPEDLYAVPDTWESYDQIAPLIDAAFATG